MNRFEKMHGKPGTKYGIYNKQAKKFQFGICEDTPMLAEARLWQKSEMMQENGDLNQRDCRIRRHKG